MPKDDSFYAAYIDYTSRLWARRWERENELVFYDSEESRVGGG